MSKVKENADRYRKHFMTKELLDKVYNKKTNQEHEEGNLFFFL